MLRAAGLKAAGDMTRPEQGRRPRLQPCGKRGRGLDNVTAVAAAAATAWKRKRSFWGGDPWGVEGRGPESIKEDSVWAGGHSASTRPHPRRGIRRECRALTGLEPLTFTFKVPSQSLCVILPSLRELV